jgi:hypothetical protein
MWDKTMPFRALVSWLLKDRKKMMVDLQLTELWKRITSIEQQLEQIKNSGEEARTPPIIVENINIEKVLADKVEYHNNFGALGIKELTGQLNIGANYGTGMPFRQALPHKHHGDKDKNLTQKANIKHSQHPDEGPRYVIKPKRY